MSDLFANIADQASHLGVPISATSLQMRPAPSAAEVIGGEVQMEQAVDSGLSVEPLSVGRLRPIISVQPDQLEEQLKEAAVLIETLNQRLPELEALTACVRAQLQPSFVARIDQKKSDDDNSVTPVDQFAADSGKLIFCNFTLALGLINHLYAFSYVRWSDDICSRWCPGSLYDYYALISFSDRAIELHKASKFLKFFLASRLSSSGLLCCCLFCVAHLALFPCVTILSL